MRGGACKDIANLAVLRLACLLHCCEERCKLTHMPSCAAACSDYSHAARVAARLNARFFNASGVGLEQGLLIHGLDHQTSGTKKQWWVPHGDRLSASYVRASMASWPS